MYELPAPTRDQNRARLATYLGPAPNIGPKAIYFTYDGANVRSTSTFRFIAMPDDHRDPTTLQPNIENDSRPWPIDFLAPPPDANEQQQEPLVEQPFGEQPLVEQPLTKQPLGEPRAQRPQRRAAARTLFDPSPTAGGDRAWHSMVADSLDADSDCHVEPINDIITTTDVILDAHDEPVRPIDILDGTAPANLNEAMRPENVDACMPAFQECVDGFNTHNTIEVVSIDDVPENERIYVSGVTLSFKRDGTLKDRWHFNGAGVNASRAADESPLSVNYETPCSSSPTASYTSFKVLCAHAGRHGMTIIQNDVNDAYLLSGAEKVYYMRFPCGYTRYLKAVYLDDLPYHPHTHVCKVIGNIWGHPDAGRIWNDEIVPVITDMGFVPTPMDDQFFYRFEPTGLAAGCRFFHGASLKTATNRLSTGPFNLASVVGTWS